MPFEFTPCIKWQQEDKTLVLLEKFWQISLYVVDDAIAQLYVT